MVSHFFLHLLFAGRSVGGTGSRTPEIPLHFHYKSGDAEYLFSVFWGAFHPGHTFWYHNDTAQFCVPKRQDPAAPAGTRASRSMGAPTAREDLPHGRISRRTGGSPAREGPPYISYLHMYICHENPPFKKTFQDQKISARFCPPRSGRPRTPHTPTLLC